MSLFTLAVVKLDPEEQLGLPVDVIHGPLEDGDLIEVEQAVELYAT